MMVISGRHVLGIASRCEVAVVSKVLSLMDWRSLRLRGKRRTQTENSRLLKASGLMKPSA
ncbi:MAG: hypothetical protein QXP28_03145 [Archaeoglobaceae archaeon]